MRTTSHQGRLSRWAAALLTTTAVTALVLGLATPPAQASGRGKVWFTTDKAVFQEHVQVHSTETFDEFATPTIFPASQRRLTIDGVRYTSWAPENPYFVIRLDGNPPRSNALSRNFTDGSSTLDLSLSFRHGGTVRAVGLMLEPFGYPNRFQIVVTLADGSVASRLLPANTDDIYIGMASRTGIVKVRITQRPDLAQGGTINFSVDDVSRSVITRRCKG